MLAVLDMIERENQRYIDIGREKGIKEGRKEGKKEGKIEGIKEKSIEIAKKLLKMGLTSEQVEEATQLKKEEIEKIARKK